MSKPKRGIIVIEFGSTSFDIGGFLGVIFMILICIGAFMPDTDGLYKIKEGKTAYTLRTDSCSLHSYSENDQRLGSSDALAWYEDTASNTQKLNGNFRRISGTIDAPHGQGENSDGSRRTIPEYWAGYDAPDSALSYELWSGDRQQTFWRIAQEDLARLSSSLPSFCVEIYGDGRLLYRSPIMLYQTTPVDFDVNVEGVQEITITWRYLFVHYGTRYGHSSVYVHDLTGHTD